VRYKRSGVYGSAEGVEGWETVSEPDASKLGAETGSVTLNCRAKRMVCGSSDAGLCQQEVVCEEQGEDRTKLYSTHRQSGVT
jgi:hypothetical protein